MECVPLRRPTACRFLLRRDWRPPDTVDTWAAAEHHPGEVQRENSPTPSEKEKSRACYERSGKFETLSVFIISLFSALESPVAACECNKVLMLAMSRKEVKKHVHDWGSLCSSRFLPVMRKGTMCSKLVKCKSRATGLEGVLRRYTWGKKNRWRKLMLPDVCVCVSCYSTVTWVSAGF